MRQFHSRVHIVNSETVLAQPLMNENVNLRVELSDLILLTITDYFSLINQQRIRNLYVQLENGRHWRKYLTSKLCNLMKNKYCIFKMTVCILVWSLCYKTVSKYLESISTVVYSLKRSQVQSSWKTLKILFNFATSSHYDTFYLYNVAPPKKKHMSLSSLLSLWVKCWVFTSLNSYKIIFYSYNSI